MPIDSDSLDLLLNTIEENCEPADYIRSRVPFMIECATLVESRMPIVAVEAMRIARNYLDKKVSADTVQRALVTCWKTLGASKSEMLLDDPNVCAIRALICVLREELYTGEEDFVDIMSFFLSLLNRVEAHPVEQAALLKRYFSGCLK
jgi:hypothetical protein